MTTRRSRVQIEITIFPLLCTTFSLRTIEFSQTDT
uniref:Uncharacterized protein n=1 Tax=Anguilla anguilla TaxID=7936 RepID=A0A0E9S6E3_ANGAN